MATLSQFSQKLTKISDLNLLITLLLKLIKKYEQEALEFNKDKLSKGIDTTGGVLHGDGNYTGTYKPYTAWKATQPPKPIKPKVVGARYNMEWSGDLFKEMQLVFSDSEANFFSSADSLEKLYDVGFEDVLGLTNPDKIKYIQTYILPAFQREIRRELNL